MKAATLAIVAVAAACPAWAAKTVDAPLPVFEALDGSAQRVQYVDYNESLVIKIIGFQDHPFLIDFGDDTVGSVAGGGLVGAADIKQGVVGAWEVTRVGQRLFVKPLAEGKRTTMLVVTAKGRTYVVDMLSLSASSKEFARRVSRVVVRQPQPPAPPPPVVTPGVGAVASAVEPAPAPAPPRVRNEQYSMEVVALEGDIRPAEVFDDGRFTYFRFPGNQPVPAIYKSLPNTTEEWLVNSHREGDYIVLHGVGKLWNLRLEGSMVGVFNDAFDAYGVPAVDGSTVPNQKRVKK